MQTTYLSSVKNKGFEYYETLIDGINLFEEEPIALVNSIQSTFEASSGGHGALAALGSCPSSSADDCASGCSFVMLQKPRSYTLRLMDERDFG